MASYDIHIKGGTVVDGTRVPRFKGDVWVKDGQVTQIGGRAPGSAEQVIDADGLIVAPGFVDLHTHYDAQIRWDPYCTISGWHGVTSVVLGNCGFGFAPVHQDFRERSMLTMTRTEAIPYESMVQGMLPHWDWETIPEYLDSLERAPLGVNCIQYMPTASLMTFVMGLDAAKTRPATGAERAEMQRILSEGMDAGLCGFSIQRLGRNSTQADFDGTPMVTDTMVDEDILCLAEVLAQRDEGFIQITQATGKIKQDLAFVERLAAVSGRPVIHNAIAPTRRNPDPHRKSLAWLAKCWDQGLQVYGQCATVRSGFVFALEDWNLYDFAKTWRALTTGSHDEKLAKMSDPELRQAMVEAETRNKAIYRKLRPGVGGPLEDLVVQGVARRPELQGYVGRSLADIGAEEGKHPGEVMLDLALATDLKAEFLGPDKGSNAEFMAELMEAPYTLPGVSDGGAHTKFLSAGVWPTDLLKWLVREEQKMTLEEAHFRLSALPAHAAGFRDRGVLREGAAADIVVYDMEELDMDPQWTGEVAEDLPGGEWRRVQRARGYKDIIVNGQVTFADGACTGALPGRLLRHGRG
jgi:N-acyl-D-amino-acid deacylase